MGRNFPMWFSADTTHGEFMMTWPDKKTEHDQNRTFAVYFEYNYAAYRENRRDGRMQDARSLFLIHGRRTMEGQGCCRMDERKLAAPCLALHRLADVGWNG